MPAPIIWALTAGTAGMRAQAEGLAQQLAAQCGGISTHGRAYLPAAARVLPPSFARHFATVDMQTPPPPQIAIGCGIDGQAAVLAAKEKYNAYAIYMQKPTGSSEAFDAIVAPAHDYRHRRLPLNLLCTVGALGKITGDVLAARREQARRRFAHERQIAVLIGGDNRAYRLDGDLLVKQISRIAAASGAVLLITPSRRTSSDILRLLHKHFGSRHYLWDGSGDNPYLDIMAAADGYCVTADSVNMISEACASGRAVYVLPLSAKSGWRATRAAQKFSAFHEALRARGNIRFFENEWEFFTATPLAEIQHVAEQLWQRYRQARGH